MPRTDSIRFFDRELPWATKVDSKGNLVPIYKRTPKIRMGIIDWLLNSLASLSVNVNDCFRLLVDDKESDILGNKQQFAVHITGVFKDLLQYGAAALHTIKNVDGTLIFKHVAVHQTEVVRPIDLLIEEAPYYVELIAVLSNRQEHEGAIGYITNEVVAESEVGTVQWLRTIYYDGGYIQHISESTGFSLYSDILKRGDQVSWTEIQDVPYGGVGIPILWFSSSLIGKPRGKSIITDRIMDVVQDLLYTVSNWSDAVSLNGSPPLVEVDAVPIGDRDSFDSDVNVVPSGPKAVLAYRSIGDKHQGKVTAVKIASELKSYGDYVDMQLKFIFMLTNLGVYELEKILASDSSAAVSKMLHRTTGMIDVYRAIVSTVLIRFVQEFLEGKVEIRWFPIFDISPTDMRESAIAVSSLLGTSPGVTLTAESASGILTDAWARPVDVQEQTSNE